ncbi:MAG: hypothetical protein ABDH18_00855 [Aquificaceae bacterium]
MKITELTQKQIEFLKNVFEEDNLDITQDLEAFLNSKGCKLYRCKSCGVMVFHDNYEFWNLSECCDDNSKLVEDGLLCEVCYSRTYENFKSWVFFRPSHFRAVDFRLPKRAEDASAEGP